MFTEQYSGELRFSHAEIHPVILDDLGLLRRRKLHVQAGEAIEVRAAPEPERFAPQLAYHFSQVNPKGFQNL